ncbi:MAG: signal peptidase II [Candidatus Marinimicrobia bacterium]|jgi:signal peptidase II|nr:signal peptidase II [Candidatus Neomarinimicrobiota bacterium]MDP7436754.1 signal peptidase II [Candidatus Neomarinimicrobiota bacterium]HBN45382.1 signal peptidase II [Candidatus Neomarinimicrobiota bacterium]|tara:strand:- start:152 stop:625 length:474 start_codon:yes stop_codon:yes gene_type:complete
MKILLVSAVVVVVDQITKVLTRSYLDLYDSVPVIKNFFHLTYITNDGMAFGLNFPGGVYVFSVISIILTVIIFMYLWKEQNNHILMRLSLALILAGAIGNLIDRLLFGEVVDFFDFMIGDFHWYIFNVADSAVTIGMFMYLYFSFYVQPKLKTETVS